MIFTFSYFVELLVKLSASGVKDYLSFSWFNMYDSIIVLMSLSDVVLSYTLLSEEAKVNGMFITILRATRIIRLFKLARYWKRFRVFLMTIWKTMSKLTSISVVLFIIVFAYTLLGIEFFGNKARINPQTDMVDPENGITPMFNFDSFLNSFFTVFLILTNDG